MAAVRRRIAFVGIPGSGKTVLVRGAAAVLGAHVPVEHCPEPLCEWVDLLREFYANPRAVAHKLEETTLRTRLACIQSAEMRATGKSAKLILFDTHVCSNAMFARAGGFLTEAQLEDICARISSATRFALETVDLYIHLRADPAIALKRIAEDSTRTSSERALTLEYMQRLETFVTSDIPWARMVTIDANRPSSLVLADILRLLDNMYLGRVLVPRIVPRGIVSVRGIMGAGKTTLAREIARTLEKAGNAVTLLEENIQLLQRLGLSEYYEHPEANAGRFQMQVLVARHAIFIDSLRDTDRGEIWIVRDGDAMSDLAFENARMQRGEISRDQHESYLVEHARVLASEPDPTLSVILDTDAACAMSRITSRARAEEQETVKSDYLATLHLKHLEISRIQTGANVIHIDPRIPPEAAALRILAALSLL